MQTSQSKVLIVDDERYNISLLVNILKSEYRTLVAKNGEEALKRSCAENPPDLILLDIMMPGIDGYEVCRRLKENPDTRNIPVIFITAMSQIADEARGLELGAIDYIRKPISPPIVRARVKNHLELKLSREQIERQKTQLEQQNQELIQAARLREDMERISRHDLRTPLSSVISFSELMMMDDNLTGDQLDSLKTIHEAGYRMMNLINLSLHLFKMEKGEYPLNPMPVNLMEVMKKIVRDLSDLMGSKKISVSFGIQGRPAAQADGFMINGEELLCYSLFQNLIKNAVDASAQGETITVSLEESDTAVIRIHNTGAVPEHIRDRFFQKNVTSKGLAGTGLGTYSARLIAETQKGSIGMETDEKKGTTITVRLPRQV